MSAYLESVESVNVSSAGDAADLSSNERVQVEVDAADPNNKDGGGARMTKCAQDGKAVSTEAALC